MDIVGKIKVTVEGAEDSRLPEANVEIVEGPSAPVLQNTDEEGFCTFLTLTPGTYRVEASMPGFETQSQTTSVRGEEETVLSFRLEAAPDNGQPG